MRWRRHLLWIDGAGGVLVGVVVLLVGGWLVTWYRLPREMVFGMAAANLLYGTYSLSLARRKIRPISLLALLVVANLTWAALCTFWLVRYWSVAHPVALFHIGAEGLYVGGLGVVEWRSRDLLRTAP